MTRVLKTKFPCSECGAPADVARLRDGPRALCVRCVTRRRAFSSVHANDSRSHEHVRAGRAASTSAGVLSAALRASAAQLEAAARCLDALPVARGVPEERHLIRCADSRIDWSLDTVRLNRRHLQRAKDDILTQRGLSVIQGQGERLETPEALPAGMSFAKHAPRIILLGVDSPGEEG